MPEDTLASYDEYPYYSAPLPASHPDRLAAIATLRGMTPTPPSACRVLELGCASGGNLIPMALTLPDSRFVGIDLSRRQVADGRAHVAALGLTNIELRHLSILEVGAALGRFDYVICHGVYSWVPAVVQDKILQICEENLSPQGVAYVTYNAYPGWHLKGMVRDMLLYQARGADAPAERVRRARAWLGFLGEALAHDGSAYGALLRRDLEMLGRLSDSYLLHEYLDEVNEPLYYHQFAERAAAKGLQCLGDAHFPTTVADNFLPPVAELLRRVSPDAVHLEQNMDVLRLRTFHHTLLCHRGVTLNEAPPPEATASLYAASPVRPTAAAVSLHSEAEEEFRAPDGSTMGTRDPVLKAALLCLSEVWPGSLSCEALRAAVQSRLGGKAPEALGIAELGGRLLRCYEKDLVELHVEPPRFVLEVRERPVTSPWARLQAAAGARVTDLRHESVELGDLDRLVTCALDGTRERDAILDALVDLVSRGVLEINRPGEPPPDAVGARAVLAAMLGQSLERLARNALLMG